jgi:hypothetical protein
MLQSLFSRVPALFDKSEEEWSTFKQELPPALQYFLNKNEFIRRMHEIKSNASSTGAFTKRFYKWFNAFRIVKFINNEARNANPDIPVRLAAHTILSTMGYSIRSEDTLKLLTVFRKLDRQASYSSTIT